MHQLDFERAGGFTPVSNDFYFIKITCRSDSGKFKRFVDNTLTLPSVLNWLEIGISAQPFTNTRVFVLAMLPLGFMSGFFSIKGNSFAKIMPGETTILQFANWTSSWLKTVVWNRAWTTKMEIQLFAHKYIVYANRKCIFSTIISLFISSIEAYFIH